MLDSRFRGRHGLRLPNPSFVAHAAGRRQSLIFGPPTIL